MTIFDNYEVWFVIGSQHLYGAEALRQVTKHAEHVVNSLNAEAKLPCRLVLKPLGTTPDEITHICRDANYDDKCAGMVVWLHTFSPAKMWINGLTILNKPLLQFHTQYNASLPWDSIDMDFMNLNQTAHGGREFGFIGARMRQQHSVVTGHWQDRDAHQRIGSWMRQAVSKQDTRHLKVCRFGDNMREVAVTDGDKVAAQIKFGFSVNTWPVGDLVQVVNDISEGEISALVDEYESSYRLTAAAQVHGDKRQNVLDAARIELGMQRFLQQGGFHAFTTTFEDLHGLKQLPGLAVQRLMQQGYGFAGEGDWKTAALLRIMKVMSTGLQGGTSFMEDYTVGLPKEQMINYVKNIYAPFTDEEISAKMVELLTPKGTKAKVEIVYQPLEGLHEACPHHKGDWYFSGNYPTPGGVKMVNRAFIDYIEQMYQF